MIAGSVTDDRRAEAVLEGHDPCIARLDAAIGAAAALGVTTDAAEAVRADAVERLGFPSDAYVVALVGGTGVGKSSLVNALAGREISVASVRRPTTSRPVAWLSAGRRDELEPLLGWLGVEHDDVRTTDASTLGDVAILDLPDLDSTAIEHRRRVEAVLPRVDAVVWVTDPEKYADAVLHDDFLATWIPRLDRQVVVLNKVDRLGARETEQVRRDLERELGELAGRGRTGRATRAPAVIAASAVGAAAAPGEVSPSSNGSRPDAGAGTDALRDWLTAHIAAKAVIRARLTAAIRDAARSLAAAARVGPEPAPILDGAARRRAIDAATAALLRIVDIATPRGSGRRRDTGASAGSRSRPAGRPDRGDLSLVRPPVSRRGSRGLPCPVAGARRRHDGRGAGSRGDGGAASDRIARDPRAPRERPSTVPRSNAALRAASIEPSPGTTSRRRPAPHGR